MRGLTRAGGWAIVLLLASSNASCFPDVVTLAQERAACRQDPASGCCDTADCAQGSVCNFSVSCGLRTDHQITCGPATGDRQCHAPCDASHPCVAGQTCQWISIFEGSDEGHGVSICAVP